MSNINKKPISLKGALISDYYTSLLHLSGSNVKEGFMLGAVGNPLPLAINPIYDGAGNSTGIKLSAGAAPGSEDLSTDVIISNYIAPSANPYVGYSQLPNSSSMVLSPVAQAQRELGIVGNDAVIYRDWLDTFYPIGSIQMTCYDDNPGNRIAGTNWVLVSQGQHPVGVGTGTDSNNNSVTFSKEDDQTAGGDRLGEYGNQLQTDQLPSHGHDLNTQTTNTPAGDASSINRLPYFGVDQNPEGVEDEKGGLNGQSYINSFQTNEDGFRDNKIMLRNLASYQYKDSDFNPELGGYSLKGWSWGSPSNESAGANLGTGWGGIVVGSSSQTEIVIDNVDAIKVGSWVSSKYYKGYEGVNYIHDGRKSGSETKLDSAGKGSKSVTYIVNIEKSGKYEVRASYGPDSKRANNTPITVKHAEGQTTLLIDQTKTPPIDKKYISLGTYQFNKGELAAVVISNENTSGYVIADSIQLLYEPAPVFTNGVRPPGVSDGSHEVILAADYDPRDSDLVHPGKIPDSSLVQIRNYLVSILGEERTTAALENVTLYRSIDGTDENVTPPREATYRVGNIPGNVNTRSTSLGESALHNNIAPCFGLYIWKRVPDDYVAPEPPVITDDDDDDDDEEVEGIVWEGTITSNKLQLNLANWATGQGWNGRDKAKITVAEGVYIYSDDAGPGDSTAVYKKIPAMQIDKFPNGLDLINNGFIMGRGGDGGSNYSKAARSQSIGVGQNGGDAIQVTSNSRIVINNKNGAIGGGGGGGGASSAGEYSGGGGGAGGGWGGSSISFNTETKAGNIGDGRRRTEGMPGWNGPGDPGLMTSGGGAGGAPGQAGGDGDYLERQLSRSISGYVYTALASRGGQAGGSGAGGRERNGTDENGTGGGGGRVLSKTATGGISLSIKAGNGGGSNSEGGDAKNERASGGGGGWGAPGGSGGGGKKMTGGDGGFVIKRTKTVTRPNYWIVGGLVYGESG